MRKQGHVARARRGDATAMLSSPIILYDHPQIAPESAGNLFDALKSMRSLR